jgi:hypothetical protein
MSRITKQNHVLKIINTNNNKRRNDEIKRERERETMETRENLNLQERTFKK